MPAGHRREYSTISFSPADSRCFAQWKANSVGCRWVPNTLRLLGNRSGRTTRFAPAGCANPVRPKARSPVRTALAQARQRPSDDQHEIGVQLYVEEGAQGLDRSATHRDRHWLHFGCTAEVDRQIVNNASALLSYYRHRPMLRLSRRPSGAGIALAKAKEDKTNYEVGSPLGVSRKLLD